MITLLFLLQDVLQVRVLPHCTAVSPEGYNFTFVFTIKCSLEVTLALCLTSADSQTKQEKHDST